MTKQLEIYKIQFDMWIAIWKNKYEYKHQSNYYIDLINIAPGCSCGFCYFFADSDCDECPLVLINDGCHYNKGGSFWKWCDDGNFHAAAHIAWVTRKEIRRIENEN